MRARLEPVDPVYLKGLREHVHETLRRAIIAGDIPSGTVLNERQVALELGVSTTPLKEALRRLEEETLSFDSREACHRSILVQPSAHLHLLRAISSHADTGNHRVDEGLEEKQFKVEPDIR